MNSAMLILPTDSREEALRKALMEKIRPRSPEEGRFEEFKRNGFDSETAAAMAGWTPRVDDYVEASIRASTTYEEPLARVQYSTAMETSRAVQNIGTAAGSAVGAVASTSLMRAAVVHGSALSVAAGAGATVVIAVVVAKVVAASLGKAAAAVAVLNVLSVATLIAFAMMRRRK